MSDRIKNLICLLVAFLINIPFVVLASMWAYEESARNLMTVVGPVGAWITIIAGVLWFVRAQFMNATATIEKLQLLVEELSTENSILRNSKDK